MHGKLFTLPMIYSYGGNRYITFFTTAPSVLSLMLKVVVGSLLDGFNLPRHGGIYIASSENTVVSCHLVCISKHERFVATAFSIVGAICRQLLRLDVGLAAIYGCHHPRSHTSTHVYGLLCSGPDHQGVASLHPHLLVTSG